MEKVEEKCVVRLEGRRKCDRNREKETVRVKGRKRGTG